MDSQASEHSKLVVERTCASDAFKPLITFKGHLFVPPALLPAATDVFVEVLTRLKVVQT